MIKKKLIFSIYCCLILSLCLSCSGKSDEKKIENREIQENIEGATETNEQVRTTPRGVRSIKVKNIGPLYKVFNDSNHIHLATAKDIGIEPITDLSTTYFTSRPIVKVESNQYYQIDSLRHSLPYLVPEAAILLQEIGKNFIDSLHNRGGDNYKIKVTSLLRTPESVGRLRRVNVNATDSSTHQFGTTFDISYTNFYCLDENAQINQGDLKNLLGEVLKDLRDKGRCHVKYEYKTGCFHITAIQ